MKLKKNKDATIAVRVSADLKSALVRQGIDTARVIREYLEKLVRKSNEPTHRETK
jgi:hypothetical protein